MFYGFTLSCAGVGFRVKRARIKPIPTQPISRFADIPSAYKAVAPHQLNICPKLAVAPHKAASAIINKRALSESVVVRLRSKAKASATTNCVTASHKRYAAGL